MANDNVEEIWKAVKEAFNETADVFLCKPSSRAPKEWLSTTTLELSDERRRLMKCISQTIQCRHNWLRREIKRRCLVDKEEYIKTICQEVHNAHYQNKSRLVYQGVRRITGHNVSRVRQVKDKN